MGGVFADGEKTPKVIGTPICLGPKLGVIKTEDA